MRIRVEVVRTRDTTEIQVPDSATGVDLLRALGLAPDAHIVIREDLPVPLDMPLREGDSLRIVGVVSGGGA